MKIKCLFDRFVKNLGMCNNCGGPCDLEHKIVPEWCTHPEEDKSLISKKRFKIKKTKYVP